MKKTYTLVFNALRDVEVDFEKILHSAEKDYLRDNNGNEPCFNNEYSIDDYFTELMEYIDNNIGGYLAEQGIKIEVCAEPIRPENIVDLSDVTFDLDVSEDDLKALVQDIEKWLESMDDETFLNTIDGSITTSASTETCMFGKEITW